jgi:hypothetical protein
MSIVRAECVGSDKDRGALGPAIDRIIAEIVDGLLHGHFDFRLVCEVTSHGQRRLVLYAGKSYRFLIPQDACECPAPLHVDSRHGSDLTNHDLDAAHRQDGEPATGSTPLTRGARAAADA